MNDFRKACILARAEEQAATKSWRLLRQLEFGGAGRRLTRTYSSWLNGGGFQLMDRDSNAENRSDLEAELFGDRNRDWDDNVEEGAGDSGGEDSTNGSRDSDNADDITEELSDGVEREEPIDSRLPDLADQDEPANPASGTASQTDPPPAMPEQSPAGGPTERVGFEWPSELDGRNVKQIAILGTYNSGKTQFITALHTEIMFSGTHNIRPADVTSSYWDNILARSDLTGRPPANTRPVGGAQDLAQNVVAYEIEEKQTSLMQRLGGGGRLLLVLTDFPGEHMIESSGPNREIFDALYAMAVRCTGIIWLVDPLPDETALELDEHAYSELAGIPTVMSRAIRQAGEDVNRRPPILIGVNKMDQFPHHWDRGQEGARELFREIYGDRSIMNLEMELDQRRRRITFMNLSSYGFTEDGEGARRPNVADQGGRQELLNREGWQPANLWRSIQWVLDAAQ